MKLSPKRCRARPRYSVILADDQREVRVGLRKATERDGRFDVVAEASDGHEAIALASLHQADALILDLAMPGVDGMEALPRIKGVAPHTVVIVLSSMVPFGDFRQKATSLGASAVFDKYTHPKAIIGTIAAFLSASWESDVDESVG